jgi:hypothetical protein
LSIEIEKGELNNIENPSKIDQAMKGDVVFLIK